MSSRLTRFIAFVLILGTPVALFAQNRATSAGQRARSNNVTVDGLDNNDSTVGSVRATFSQEAVQEFQVLAQGYTAECGKA